MAKPLLYVWIIATAATITSCQTDTDRANEVINTALRMNQANSPVEESPASDTAQLGIQTSAYTGPVKKAPTEEELIKKYRVKSIKSSYEGGWSITNYDKKGAKISEESDYSGKKKISCKFDNAGRTISEKTTYKDGSSFTIEYKYNDEGKLIHKTFTDSDGKKTETSIEYNTRLNTRTEISSTGIDKEFYDNRGLRVRFESYDDTKKMIGYGEATYDEDGLKKSERAVIMGMNTFDEYEYNTMGQLLKQHRTGILDVYFIFEYNEKGLKVNEKNIKGMKEEETLYTYTYY